LKKWIALAMAVVFVLSISGAAMAAGKLVKVPTAWMDEHETFLMWYAKEKGWDKEAGLDVEIKYFNSGADILNALPSGEWVFAGMGAAPAVSRQESNRVHLKRTMRQLLLLAGLIGCLSSCVLFLFAQPISMLLYGEPALTGVLMALSPLSMLFAIQQVQFGLVTGLGVQRRAMTGTIVSSALTLVVMSALCPMPSVRIFGAVLAMLAGSLVRVIWNAAVLQSAKRAA